MTQLYLLKYAMTKQRYSSVVLSAPTILRSQVQIPNKAFKLPSFYNVEIETVIVGAVRKRRKSGQDWPI